MKCRAFGPQFSEILAETEGAGWCITVRYIYEPGEVAGVVHSLSSFATEDEAKAYQAEINGQIQ
jgi:hypothetical protein